MDNSTERNYGGLAEIAAILTGNNPKAVEDMLLLVRGRDVFIAAHPGWWEEMFDDEYDDNEPVFMLNAFAYWLAGYESAGNQPMQFGAYIDWKEETEDIVWQLSNADKNLGYGLDFGKMEFGGEESTEEALSLINKNLSAENYMLISLDTDSDCYHLFLIPVKDYDRVMRLAEDAGFKFIKFE